MGLHDTVGADPGHRQTRTMYEAQTSGPTGGALAQNARTARPKHTRTVECFLCLSENISMLIQQDCSMVDPWNRTHSALETPHDVRTKFLLLFPHSEKGQFWSNPCASQGITSIHLH